MFWTSEPGSLKTKLPSTPYDSKKSSNFLTAWLRGKSEKRHQSDEKKPGVLLLLFGVLLPLAAVVFETTTHICAQNCFDPFPSTAHVLLFMLIPISNAMIWLSARRNLSNHYGFMALSSGMAMGIGILYSLMFIPLVPMSLLMLLWLGFGLLGLSPLLSLPCTASAGKSICKRAIAHKTFFDPSQVKHIGHLIILVTVIAVELPSTLTRINLGKAANPGTAKEGIRWLRQLGSQEVMLRACYERSGRATDILGSLYESTHPLSVKDARNIFYKVTGMPFNSVPIPSSARATIQHAGLMDDPDGFNVGVDDEFDRDPDIAGEVVSGVARGLSLGQSNITGEIDVDGALANISWTFTFKNSSQFDREARAKILLPPNAVVTGAILRVNDKEREANIMARSTARSYYRSAAVKKKDPLLVSTSGSDRVLVQCYPIRPQSKMTVCLRMVSPLAVDKGSNAILMLPAFEERNFQIDVPHSIVMASDDDIVALGTSLAMNKSNHESKLTGVVDNAQLARFSVSILGKRDPRCHSVWCQDRFVLKNCPHFLTHNIADSHYPLPAKLTVIIDGSVGMSQYLRPIAEGLRNIPPSISTNIEFIQDENAQLCPLNTKAGNAIFQKALDSLAAFTCAGGQDDMEALISACSMAKTSDSAVLWIHGAQVNNSNPACLRNMLIAKNKSPILYDFQVASGPNEILAGINNCPALVRVLRTNSVQEDLKGLFASLKPQSNYLKTSSVSDSKELQIERPVPHIPRSGSQTFDSLAQLAAYRRLLDALASNDQTMASYLATTYHLVTPVSSAIVVDPTIVAERKQQVSVQAPGPIPSMRLGLRSRLSQLASEVCDKGRPCLNNGYFASKQERLEEERSRSTAAELYPSTAVSPILSSSAANDAFMNAADTTLLDGTMATDNADPATVPEADTWILLCIVAGILPVAIYLRVRIRVCRA